MNTPLAQIVALVCHANVAARDGSAPSFFPGSSTCQFCDRVSFDGGRRGWFGLSRGPLDASAPDEWLAKLRPAGVVAARLRWGAASDLGFSDRMTAGLVGGGGEWLLETLADDGTSGFWLADWQVWNREAPEQRIWRVAYRVIRTSRASRPSWPAVEAATEQLRRALLEIAEFSRRMQCDPFTAAFDTALAALSRSERTGYHRDLDPAGILTEAEARILDAVQSAYVFGGMGSWNDMGFEGAIQSDYERLSEEAFRALNVAIVAAVNGPAGRTLR